MNTQPDVPAQTRLVLSCFGFALLVAHFAPWAAHHTAALTLSAHDLAVFTNYTPGAGIFWNEWFLLPLWGAAVALAQGLRRLLGMGLGLFIAALGLPGYPAILTAFQDVEHQLRFFASLLTAVLAVIAAWRSLSNPFRAALALVMLSGMAAVPLFGFIAVRPFIRALYGSPVMLGWGWWLTLLAVGSALSYAGVTIVQQLRQHHNPNST